MVDKLIYASSPSFLGSKSCLISPFYFFSTPIYWTNTTFQASVLDNFQGKDFSDCNLWADVKHIQNNADVYNWIVESEIRE